MSKSDESEMVSDDTAGDTMPPPDLNIYQRLHRIRGEVQRVEKAGKHAHFAFAKHDDVTATLAPLYLKYGVDRQVSMRRVERSGSVLGVEVELAWVNIDNPDDKKSVVTFAEGIDNGFRKDGSPNIDGLASGKAVSYAVKIAEMKNFCLVGESTPDNERAALGAPNTAPVAAPSSDELQKLKELYQSCGTKEELQAIRKMIAPLVASRALTSEQVAELSPLDHQASQRIGK